MSQQFVVLFIVCLSVCTKATFEGTHLDNEFDLEPFDNEADPFEMFDMLDDDDDDRLYVVNESSPQNLASLEFMMESIRNQIKALQDIQFPDELLPHHLTQQYEGSTCSKRATVKPRADGLDAQEFDECY